MASDMTLAILIKARDLASTPLRAVTTGLSKIGTTADAAGKRLKVLQDKLKAVERAGESMAKAIVPGAAVAAGIGGTIAAFATLEEAQNRLKTNMMDAAGKVSPEFDRLLKLADRLGTELPGSTKDMIEMFTALREQGVQTNVILGGMGEAAAKFAVLMKVPFSEAATHVAKFSEAMGIADRDAVQFMDVLQRLKSAGGVNVSDLAETFKYSGAALKSLRLQGMQAGKDVSAAIGMMATSSIEGSQAGTNFSMALSRMAEISHRLESKKIKELIGPILDAKGIDLNFFDRGGNFVGIRGMIQELEKLRAINPQEQLVVLSKLFGQEAARPLSVFINQGVKGFDEMNRRMREQADMQAKLKTIMAGLQMKWETMTGTLSNVIGRIGGVTSAALGLPVILESVNSALGKVDAWISGHPKIAATIMQVVASVSALLLAIGSVGVVMAVSAVASSFMLSGLLRLAAGLRMVLVAVRAVSMAMLANPVALIAAGIAVSALLIYTYWAPISRFFRQAWHEIKVEFERIWPWFQSLPGRFYELGTQLLTGLINGIRSKLAAIKETLVGVGNEIISAFGDTLEIRSPSRVFARMGSMAGEGMRLGMLGRVPTVQSAGKGLAVAALAGSVAAMPGGQARAAGHITYAPVIHVAAADASGVRSQVEQALRVSQAEFEKMLARAEQNGRRKGFA